MGLYITGLAAYAPCQGDACTMHVHLSLSQTAQIPSELPNCKMYITEFGVGIDLTLKKKKQKKTLMVIDS